MRSLVALWLVSLLFHVSMAQDRANKPQLSPKEQKSATSAQHITEKPPAALPRNTQASSEPGTNGTQASSSYPDNKASDDRIVKFTGALAVLAFLQFAAMILQYCAMRKQADYMKRGLRISISSVRVAKKSADAAKTSAEAAYQSIEMMVNRERARVRVETVPFDLDSPPVLGVKQVNFKVFSYGQTPAFIHSSGEWVEIDESPEYDRGDHVFPPIRIPAVFHPSQEGYDTSALLFTSLDEIHVDRIYRGKLFIHFQGYIKYRDVFGRDHETRFSYKWVPGLPPGSVGVSVKYWTEVGGKERNYET